jgi:hypothetical protein
MAGLLSGLIGGAAAGTNEVLKMGLAEMAARRKEESANRRAKLDRASKEGIARRAAGAKKDKPVYKTDEIWNDETDSYDKIIVEVKDGVKHTIYSQTDLDRFGDSIRSAIADGVGPEELEQNIPELPKGMVAAMMSNESLKLGKRAEMEVSTDEVVISEVEEDVDSPSVTPERKRKSRAESRSLSSSPSAPTSSPVDAKPTGQASRRGRHQSQLEPEVPVDYSGVGRTRNLR